MAAPQAPAATVTQAFAAAAASLVEGSDVVDIANRLLRDCVQLVALDLAGVVLLGPDEQFELLASTSHDVCDLDVLAQGAGLWLDVVRSGRPVVALSDAQASSRWLELHTTMTRDGWALVHAAPLRWHGRPVGAWCGFARDATPLAEEQQQLVQAFGDMLTAAIVHADRDGATTVLRQTRQALAGRTLIEQAKGVLAYQLGVGMDSAFGTLMTMADRSGQSLSVVAEQVVNRAVAR